MKQTLVFSVPAKAVPFDVYQSVLVNACVAHATDWNLPAELVATMQTKKKDWDAACEITSNRQTMNPAAIAARNALLGDYRDLLARVMRLHIASNDAVSESDKAALGIHPVKPSRSPVHPPVSYPVLSIDLSVSSAHRIRFRDSEALGSFGRAKTASYCELWYRLGGAAPTGPGDAGLRCNLSRSGQLLAFDVANKGNFVHYFARWVNKKGQQGPWSPVYSALIA